MSLILLFSNLDTAGDPLAHQTQGAALGKVLVFHHDKCFYLFARNIKIKQPKRVRFFLCSVCTSRT